MDKDKIIDYVMNTPGNTNKMVLEGMLGDTDGVKLPEISEEDEGKVLTVIDGKWDKGVASSDKGYECTEEYTLLTDESVTTEHPEVMPEGMYIGVFTYSTPITADTIKVTFNGVEYTCQRRVNIGGNNEYGAPYNGSTFDWSEYSFSITGGTGNNIATETAGTYQVKIEALEQSVETSECFEKAVKKVGTGPLIVRVDHVDEERQWEVCDKTWKEVADAIDSGTAVYFARQSSTLYPIVGYDNSLYKVTFFGEDYLNNRASLENLESEDATENGTLIYIPRTN